MDSIGLARLVWVVAPLCFELLERLIDLQLLLIPPSHAELELLHSGCALFCASAGRLGEAVLPLLELLQTAGGGHQLRNGRVLLHCNGAGQ